MATLGLAIIVKDEERNLSRLLSSVKGILDEIVVVDTGSKDKTKEIAKSFGAKIYDFEWIDDFSAARSFSFSKVTSEWTMWLDGDDELVPEDQARLLELKKHLGEADAYLMAYNYAQDAQGKPIVRFYRHRILRTSLGIRWKDRIHEHLNILPGTREAMTNVVVTHRRSGEDSARDKGRNIRLLRKAIADDPNNQRLKFYFGKELYSEGEIKESIQVLESYLTKGDWHDNMVNGFFWLAMGYISTKEMEKAIDTCLRGIRLDPRWAEPYCLIGQIYYDRGDWGRASQWYEIASKLSPPSTWGTVIMDNYTWVPHDRLTKCYAELGEWRKAYEENETALGHTTEPRMLYNREFLRDRLYDRLSERPVRLNLGAGPKKEPSYRSSDYYPGEQVEFVLDQAMLPWRDATVHAIYSEHALEHSASHILARQTIKEWARALRYGGRLHLKLPDLDQCCMLFVAQEDRARRTGERYTPKEWYRYTIYGIQESQGSEPPEGQYHRTGFTQGELKRLLLESGFEVEKISTYDGWGTPSIEAVAIQRQNSIKVRWLMRGSNEDDPSSRIRRLNVHRWLGTHGVDSKIVMMDSDLGKIFAQMRDADVVVFTFFGDPERRLMDMLRRAGVAAVADYNEDLVDLSPSVADCLRSATRAVCCSEALSEKTSDLCRTLTVEDAYEIPEGKG